MAVKRDYGSFSKASVRILAPAVASLGYHHLQGAAFGREKSGWVEGFFLQQSQWGSGDFCVNVGIHVPTLEELWSLDHAERSFGLLIAWRLSDIAPEYRGERWYHAKDKEQLESNLSLVAETLSKADSWFEQFRSFSDVVERYRLQAGLPESPFGDDRQVVDILNYSLLLMLDGAKQRAREWLILAMEILERPVYWNSSQGVFGHNGGPGFRLMKPSKDDELRKRVIQSALEKLQC